MGWTYRRGATKADVIAENLRTWDWVTTAADVEWTDKPAGTRIYSKVLAKAVVGNSLWTVRETVNTYPDARVESKKWIGLTLMEPGPDGWGAKNMDESVGPYDTSCPVEFLDLAPVDSESPYAAAWRAKILAAARPVNLKLNFA